MDRREVHHVEAHLGDLFEALVAGVEGARDPRPGLLVVARADGAGEELVPGGEESLAPVHEQGEVGSGRHHLTGPVQAHRAVQAAAVTHVEQVLGRSLGDQELGGRAQDGRFERVVGGLRPPRGALHEVTALHADQFDVHAGGELRLGVVQPGPPRVRPALDAERPVPLAVGADPGLPRVEAAGLDGEHVDAGLASVGVGEDDRRVHRVVSLAEHLGANGDEFPDHGLRGIGAALDDGFHLRDGDASDAPDDDASGGEIDLDHGASSSRASGPQDAPGRRHRPT